MLRSMVHWRYSGDQKTAAILHQQKQPRRGKSVLRSFGFDSRSSTIFYAILAVRYLMIIFDLACQQEHPFEGWFQSLQDYDGQLARGLVACPHCGSTQVRRVPSAIHLTKPAHTSSVGNDTQVAVLAAYRQLMTAMLANSEDVGKNFAAEARRIHYHEAPERSIRGEASADDCESLREEGVEVLLLPRLKAETLN